MLDMQKVGNGNLIEYIETIFFRFIKREHKLLAKYIISNYDKVSFMTAESLAKATESAKQR